MKGFVLHFGRRRLPARKRNFTIKSLPRNFRRYSVVIFFTVVFAGGMLMGTLSAQGADEVTLKRLDFLFTTNLDARLGQSVLSTFTSSFASNFLFLLFVFLCGLAPWGMAFVFVAPAFKGFGTGLSAGYLFITYGFKGVGFYLLVVLGGTFIFCFSLIVQCVQAHLLSFRIARCVFLSKDDLPVATLVRAYLFRSLYMLILTTGAALLDMLLWTVFSGLFF